MLEEQHLISFEFVPLAIINVFIPQTGLACFLWCCWCHYGSLTPVVCLTVKADFMHKQEFLRHMSKSPVTINTHKHLDLASKLFFCYLKSQLNIILCVYILLIVISIFS